VVWALQTFNITWINLFQKNYHYELLCIAGTLLVSQVKLNKDAETAKVGAKAIILSTKEVAYLLCFASIKGLIIYVSCLLQVGNKILLTL